MSRFWSKSLTELTPYVPGEQPKVENLIKLNTNENPYGPSPLVLAAIQQAANSDLRKYPDPNATTLKDTIAQYHRLKADQVFVANSSDEVLAHTFRALFQHRAPILFPDLTYSFYPVYCQLFDIRYSQIALREDFSLAVEDYAQHNGGIIFANPNAPTGLALNRAALQKLLQLNSNSVVVVDEAYVDFSNCSAVNLIDQYSNLLVIQTLSKSRSLAGLRVGFALGHVDLIAGLERVKNSFHPYALDKLAIAGATAAFTDQKYFEQMIEKIVATRKTTISQLTSQGFEVLPSEANFVLARHPNAAAKDLYQALRERKILVRHFNLPRINDYIRITIGTDEEMAALLQALQAILAE